MKYKLLPSTINCKDYGHLRNTQKILNNCKSWYYTTYKFQKFSHLFEGNNYTLQNIIMYIIALLLLFMLTF